MSETPPSTPPPSSPALLPDVVPNGPESTLDAALEYVREGFAVVPLHAVRWIGGEWICTCNRRPCQGKPGKHPQRGYSLLKACTTENQVRLAWVQIPDGNVGIVVPEGHFVADLDGTEALAWWEAAVGDALPTRTTISGGGGEHRWYRLPEGESVRNGQLMSWGEHSEVKIITAGKGFLVAPPSRHVSGAQYQWKHGWNAVELPSPLLSRLRATELSPSGLSTTPNGGQWFESVANMGVGSGRGTVLTSYAGKLISIGMDPEVIEAQAMKLNAAFMTPHTEAEALTIIKGCIGRYQPGTAIASDVLRIQRDARFEAKLGEQRVRERERNTKAAGVDEDEPHPITVRRVADLRQLPDAHVEWVVERFAAEGAITDLTGYIKSGKSTLIVQMVAAVLHGDDFLNRYPSKRSPVVLLTEERPASLVAALDDAGVTDEDGLHILLWTENSGIDWPTAVMQAGDLSRREGARLLVIDTLGIWAEVEDENAATEARAAMKPVMEVASGLAVLILRQARKSGGEIHNAGRGSGAYGGAADILLNLDYMRDEKNRQQEESSKRWLSIKSRLERDQIPAMRLDHRNGQYFEIEDLTPVDVPARTKIMRDLKDHGQSRPADIAKRTGLDRRAVSVTLGRSLPLVIRVGDGTWKLSPLGEPVA